MIATPLGLTNLLHAAQCLKRAQCIRYLWHDSYRSICWTHRVAEKRGAVESLQIITISQNVQEELSPTTARACFTQAEQEGETLCISVFTIRLVLTGMSVPPYSINPALKQLCQNYKQKLRLHTYKESQSWERAAPSPCRGPSPAVPLNSTGTPSKSLTHFHTLGIRYIQDLYIIS